MKILFKTIIILLILTTILSSCDKDETKPSGEYFIATIGVEQVEFKFIKTLFTNSFGPPYKLLDIFATSSNNVSIRISQPGYLATESHYERTLAKDNLLSFLYQDEYEEIFVTKITNEILDPGNLDIIEETDTYIKGTFHFIAHNSDNLPIPVSNGKFLVFK